MNRFRAALISGSLIAALAARSVQDARADFFLFSDQAARDNFADFQNAAMGTYIGQFREDLTKVQTLPNGNDEYETKFGVGGRCIVIYEFDARTKRAVAWKTEGDPGSCIIPP